MDTVQCTDWKMPGELRVTFIQPLPSVINNNNKQSLAPFASKQQKQAVLLLAGPLRLIQSGTLDRFLGRRFTFDEVRQTVLLHVFGGVVEADVIHLRGQEVPAVHRGSQQGVDAGSPSACGEERRTRTALGFGGLLFNYC